MIEPYVLIPEKQMKKVKEPVVIFDDKGLKVVVDQTDQPFASFADDSDRVLEEFGYGLGEDIDDSAARIHQWGAELNAATVGYSNPDSGLSEDVLTAIATIQNQVCLLLAVANILAGSKKLDFPGGRRGGPFNDDGDDLS